MPTHSYDPFDSIESAHEFLDLLSQAIEETVLDVNAEIAQITSDQPSRKLEALRLATFQLEMMRNHMVKSRRLLNDFRSVRRLLMQEGSHRGRLENKGGARRQVEDQVSDEETMIAA